MSHAEFQELVAGSAAGLLDAAEERRLREHLRECPECAARAEEYAAIGQLFGALEPPVPPADLGWRTQALLRAELAAADRRQGAILAGVAVGLAWASLLMAVYILRWFTQSEWVIWLLVATIPTTGAMVAGGALLRVRMSAKGRA